MNPTESNPGPPEDGTDPSALPPAVPQEQEEEDAGAGLPVVDASGTGEVLGGVADAGAGTLNAVGGVADMADAAGGALEGAGSALEGAGSALDVAGGCLDGCGGCSLAILLTLFAAAGTAMALLR
jgi:hypothetical protein